ncbi:hypothetical protein VP01_3861g1 [Puccinia sorghi]|uniref:Uncharacterized protein n=1 Tax=Puccinia sorghi TaxID=27349 RepID=A0A0L6UT13_9BASI|nr:hypothetical protein VP01_3861g1 [Puccinia sorghi]
MAAGPIGCCTWVGPEKNNELWSSMKQHRVFFSEMCFELVTGRRRFSLAKLELSSEIICNSLWLYQVGKKQGNMRIKAHHSWRSELITATDFSPPRVARDNTREVNKTCCMRQITLQQLSADLKSIYGDIDTFTSWTSKPELDQRAATGSGRSLGQFQFIRLRQDAGVIHFFPFTFALGNNENVNRVGDLTSIPNKNKALSGYVHVSPPPPGRLAVNTWPWPRPVPAPAWQIYPLQNQFRFLKCYPPFIQMPHSTHKRVRFSPQPQPVVFPQSLCGCQKPQLRGFPCSPVHYGEKWNDPMLTPSGTCQVPTGGIISSLRTFLHPPVSNLHLQPQTSTRPSRNPPSPPCHPHCHCCLHILATLAPTPQQPQGSRSPPQPPLSQPTRPQRADPSTLRSPPTAARGPIQHPRAARGPDRPPSHCHASNFLAQLQTKCCSKARAI